MSLTLKDLWIEEEDGALNPASLADLVEVLKAEGAVREACQSDDGEYDLSAPGPGRYLILPLGDTP